MVLPQTTVVNPDILRVYADLHWMYFVVKPRCEKKLYESLKAQGTPCYLPLLPKTTEYSKRIYRRMVPMLSGYVFAAIRPNGCDFQYMNSAILRINKMSEIAAVELLEDLKIIRKYELLAMDHKVEISPEIVPGTPVLICKGNFKGEYAIVERRKKMDTVIINLNCIQISLRVELPVSWVEPA